MRLLTDPTPLTYESDWFKTARGDPPGAAVHPAAPAAGRRQHGVAVWAAGRRPARRARSSRWRSPAGQRGPGGSQEDVGHRRGRGRQARQDDEPGRLAAGRLPSTWPRPRAGDQRHPRRLRRSSPTSTAGARSGGRRRLTARRRQLAENMAEGRQLDRRHARRPGRRHRALRRGDGRLRRAAAERERVGLPRGDAQELRADRAVRDAALPGLAGRHRGLVQALGGQGCRDRYAARTAALERAHQVFEQTGRQRRPDPEFTRQPPSASPLPRAAKQGGSPSGENPSPVSRARGRAGQVGILAHSYQ